MTQEGQAAFTLPANWGRLTGPVQQAGSWWHLGHASLQQAKLAALTPALTRITSTQHSVPKQTHFAKSNELEKGIKPFAAEIKV